MELEILQKILEFRDNRNWKQFHNPKDLAISINLEAAELLEIFQWSADDVTCSNKFDSIREELSDILIYCIYMADLCGFNLNEILMEKIKKNSEKYPVEKAFGNKNKYTDFFNE